MKFRRSAPISTASHNDRTPIVTQNDQPLLHSSDFSPVETSNLQKRPVGQPVLSSSPLRVTPLGASPPVSNINGTDTTSTAVKRRQSEESHQNAAITDSCQKSKNQSPKEKDERAKQEMQKYYKQRVSLDQRVHEVIDIKDKFPGKVMVILERFKKERHLPVLDRIKYLVPQTVTLSQFVTIIRNRMDLRGNQAIYFLVDDRAIASMTTTMGEIYDQYHDKQDRFLYMKYASQETFG